MHAVLPLIPWLLVLGSCTSPPKPPTVDESTKRPANAAVAVELQVCKVDLQNTRIHASEADRLADSTTARLEWLTSRQQTLAAAQAPRLANTVVAVQFAFGSTRLDIAPDTATALIDAARSAPLVLLRGRTDGITDSLAEGWIARERSAAVRDYLVGAGVDPTRIRATYQPTGDHVADNTSPNGRSLNRRVEIELYRVAPVAANAANAAIAASASNAVQP